MTSLPTQQPTGIERFIDRYADEYHFYGSGKVALRDGLAGLVDGARSQNVLVPAYLPDGVVEPLRELEVEPRYYAVEPTLAPDFVDLERRLDEDTLAVMSVNYFGFPQPGLAELESIVADADCYHIDDNAHAPLSVDHGTLLGTRGDIGITSLWKLLPIPNGAILYCTDESVSDRYEPSPLAGIRGRVDASDCRYILKSVIQEFLDTAPPVRHSVDALLTGRRSGSTTPTVGSPADRYEAWKTQMSTLSAYLANDIDPTEIRQTRRDNFRIWRHILDDYDTLDPVFDSLPDGICPQAFPVRTDDARAFIAELERVGVDGVHTWPRLAGTVLENPAYETATRLSREIVTLPVHQHVDSAALESVGDALQWE
ncbi:DegT/DnrJ/EryC1/StrS aminotransferase [Natrialba magadii ATCC 43099]|uniref:DegT/DnrJ/EryC1/StrS aminotransferase n=1 Tax=Natrialba magadii (strain ATCC 43099 / DSM 3394 / CCM 3739 / CIP 104546 / IAM 13178 / JCM 8861 / NBRC 102185 / NCIMB 2190 / MS3) TaxID=547559 RepID=L9V427_NATMM|nr:DegT/DnrJ/EryC1/StrS aminotransferase [Natrialba magadii ATCC 43099]